MTTLNHSGVKGQKRGVHQFGKWQPQAKYANGQPDPNAKDKKKEPKSLAELPKGDKKAREEYVQKLQNSRHKREVAARVIQFIGNAGTLALWSTPVSWPVAMLPGAVSDVIADRLYKETKQEREVREDDEDTFKKLMEEARAKKMKHSDIHKDLVHSALMARFEEEIYHSDSFEHHGVPGQEKNKHKFGKWQPQAKYANGQPDPNGKKDKPPKKEETVKAKQDRVTKEVTKKTKQVISTITKAKERAVKVQAKLKETRDNKKKADEMLSEEQKRIKKIMTGDVNEMSMDELKERNERMKLIQQYNDAYKKVYPDTKAANKEARKKLVNAAMNKVIDVGIPAAVEYAVGSSKYGRDKREFELSKIALETEKAKADADKGRADAETKALDIEKQRLTAAENRQKNLEKGAAKRLEPANAKKQRAEAVLNRMTARADKLATAGKRSFLLDRAIKRQNKVLDKIEKEIQKGNDQYAKQVEGIYKDQLKTNLIALSAIGEPKQEEVVDKTGLFGKRKYTYKKTYNTGSTT